jgi:hypothetical protein
MKLIEEEKMGTRVSRQEVVKKFLDTKAVDFAAIGKVVAEIGPSLAMADEPWEGFCGTMRTFFHCYIIQNPTPTQVLYVPPPTDLPKVP